MTEVVDSPPPQFGTWDFQISPVAFAYLQPVVVFKSLLSLEDNHVAASHLLSPCYFKQNFYIEWPYEKAIRHWNKGFCEALWLHGISWPYKFHHVFISIGVWAVYHSLPISWVWIPWCRPKSIVTGLLGSQKGLHHRCFGKSHPRGWCTLLACSNMLLGTRSQEFRNSSNYRFI